MSAADDRGSCLEAQDVAARTHALRLLKRKLQRTRVPTQSGRRSATATHAAPNGAIADRVNNNDAMDAAATATAALLGDAKAAVSIAGDQPERSSPPLSVSAVRESDCNNSSDLEPTIEQLKQRMAPAVILESTRRSGSSRPQSREQTNSIDSAVPAPPPPTRSSVGTRTHACGGGASHGAHQSKAALTKLVVKWSCTTCKRECIPIREESRCLCGHRYKEHPWSPSDPRVKSKDTFRAFACTSVKCACRAFFYVVAEGAWILRCRCKHKHTDHDPSRAPFGCAKPTCRCAAFDSPWICNCDHAWASHTQEVVEKTFQPLELLQQQFELQELNNVQRTDLVAEPLVHARAVTHSAHV